MIGSVDPSNDRHREAREVYKKEAHEISKALESNHHSRRLKNMQVYYPDTVSKLSHAPAPAPYKAPPPQHQMSHNMSTSSEFPPHAIIIFH